MKSLKFYFALLLAISLVIAATMPALAAEPQVLTYVQSGEPKTLDPAVSVDDPAGIIIRNVYGRLVDLTPDGVDTRPDLAESWEVSDDGLTYTFYLREGVTFHDGTPFTAEAVKSSFERTMVIGEGYSWMLTDRVAEDGIQVVDDHTVEIKLKQPYGAFLKVLSQQQVGAIVNPAMVEANATDEDPYAKDYVFEHMSGTGPFVFKEWVHNQYVVIEKNPDYWGEEAKLDQIIFRVIEEPATKSFMLQKGDVDIVHKLPTDMTAELREVPDITIISAPMLEETYFVFQHELEPFNDVRVRQALVYAVDYDGILTKIVGDQGTRMRGLLLPGMLGYDDNQFTYIRDVERAKALLAEAGYADGFTTQLYYPEWGNIPDIAVVLQQNFADIGVTLELMEVGFGPFIDMASEGEAPMFPWEGTPAYNDPDALLMAKAHSSSIPKGAGGNIAHYRNAVVDQLLEQGAAETDEAVRESIYQQIQTILVNEVYGIFLFQTVNQQPVRSWVKGYTLPVLGQPGFAPVYLEK